jgi:hypothetical protein
MTRCADCGSERVADQCASCGLTSAAAELVFRRRLLNRTAVFLVGSLAFPYVSQLYPPLDLDLMLVFFGLLFFVALAIAMVLDRRARNRQELEILKRIYAGFIPLPWLLAAALFLNGKLDAPKNIVYRSSAVENRFYMKGLLRGSRRLFVDGWRAGQKIERLPVDADDFDRFQNGDTVLVGIEPGALGIPWFYGIYRR